MTGEAMCVFLSEALIRNRWLDIQRDPDNPRPDVTSPDDWIELAKAGELMICGAAVFIHNSPACLHQPGIDAARPAR